MSRTPTKDKVYLGLVVGDSIREVSRRLRLDEKSVRLHANDLVARGVLKRESRGPGHALKFSRGAKWEPYESTISTRKGDRVGSGAGAPRVALRVHRGGCAFEVRGAISEVPWQQRWSASGVANFAIRDAAGNRFWVVKEKGAPHKLMVQPTEEWVYNPSEVEGARAARVERVRALAAAFVKEHGLKFASVEAYEFQPLEYAAEMPGLEVFGSPGESFVWVDGSPGDGRLEMETQEPEFAKLMLEWPDVLRRLAETEQHVVVAHQAIHGLLGLQEKVVGVLAPKPGKPAKALPPVDDPAVA